MLKKRKVLTVSAFVPLNVKHMTADKYHELGYEMLDAAAPSRFFDNYPLEKCWSYDLCKDLPPATETPADRYATPEDHVRSHIVQHTRTQWALEAVKGSDYDTVVWLDLGILKQGHWNKNPVTWGHIVEFTGAVRRYQGDDIPFPGIDPNPDHYDPHGNNWRFCGSTHIWPVEHLKRIDSVYRTQLKEFIKQHKKVPLDLAIWPLVEKHSNLPFKFYQAEYDASQLTNFPK